MPTYSGRVEIPAPQRLDRYIAEKIRLLSRSQIKARSLRALVNGKAAKLSRLIKAGDLLELSYLSPSPLTLIPEDIPLDILYEDSRVAVINKSRGMVVHPGAGNRSGTLANALVYRYLGAGALLSGGSASFREGRWGIVHRLDKDTSGCIITAKDEETLAFLAEQFKSRLVTKRYLALVWGTPREERGTITARIGRDPRNRKLFAVVEDGAIGKAAVSSYRVLHSWAGRSLVLLSPKTGRTHQLRVHMRFLGHPIIGDPLYGKGGEDEGLMLHAWKLRIKLPGEDAPRTFTAPLAGTAWGAYAAPHHPLRQARLDL